MISTISVIRGTNHTNHASQRVIRVISVIRGTNHTNHTEHEVLKITIEKLIRRFISVEEEA